MQGYNTPARIGKLKGEILAHAIGKEVLGITGQQKQIPKNNSNTVVFRRFVPFGATAANPNQFSISAINHMTQEGVTPKADTLTPMDVEVTLKQYSVLYSLTDQMMDFHEDASEIVAEMKAQTGERLGMVREQVRYGALKGCTNKFYGGTGNSRATVNGKVSLPLLRKITRSLRANHAEFITSVLSPSPLYGTTAVEQAFLVFCHTDVEQDIRDLPGFKETAVYGQRKVAHEMEIGACESYRFILSPELQSYPNAGAAVGSAPGMFSTSGANVDVYPLIVTGKDAWGQVMLRGAASLDVTAIMPGVKSGADPLGQRGYVGAKTYHAALVLNQGWMAVGEVAITAL